MATVIFSNMGDTDTAVLKYIWMGMPKVKVVEITRDTVNPKALVNEAIENEHDTLIMCGHGTPSGLMNPGFKGGAYLVDQSNYQRIKCNRVIAVWCHAKDFAETYGVKGFWSSMFISNLMEAHYNHIYNTDAGTITHDETMFCLFTNYLIRNNVPQENWIDVLCKCVEFNDPVIRFNYSGLVYYAEAPKPKYNYDYWYRTMGFENTRWWG